ncbi:hypothetical protein PHMEG_00028050 [Phytophthora megakarya]|uniref:Uncharacterized protein n=1 Tax=Phytophthora megakarya TaxID=4795 RepID=A0A225V5Y1_9STRA|nr:hypothetical protein PHMEG_00028050 [Phytophthora megakarya]
MCTPEIEETLVGYVDENCIYTLAQMQERLRFNFGVRVESETYNIEANFEKRRAFGEALLAHEDKGSFIIYYDEAKFNLYCKRAQGRYRIAERAAVKLQPIKGPKLQLQWAVSPEGGLVHWLKGVAALRWMETLLVYTTFMMP